MKTKTTILCSNRRVRHTVTRHEDGTLTSTGCVDLNEQAARYGILARLRSQPLPEMGCVALAALVRCGLPQMLQQKRSDNKIEYGAWKNIYIRYESNSIVKAAADEVRRERDDKHGETFKHARKALRQADYRGGWSKVDIDENTCFVPNSSMDDGLLVAVGQHDEFTIPLQEGWLDSVQKAGIAVVSGKFVCGIDIDNPRQVFAIGKAETGLYVLRRYDLVTKPSLRLQAVA